MFTNEKRERERERETRTRKEKKRKVYVYKVDHAMSVGKDSEEKRRELESSVPKLVRMFFLEKKKQDETETREEEEEEKEKGKLVQKRSYTKV
jgi:hypothetical protein